MEIKKKKIIIILEDEKPLARALELKLTHEGYDVRTLENGQELMPLLEKNECSLIVCDMLMPKFDGFQVLQLLKEKSIKVPVIVMTNLSQPEDEKRVKELGAVEFFIKSDTPISDVVQKIKERVGPV